MVVDDVFDVSGGNSGLTEEFIYNNAPSILGDRIEVITSATEQANSMGYVSKQAVLPNGKPIKIFDGECIVVARNGYAGTMRYSNGKRFTANDHVYVLTAKPEWQDRIYLEWFIQQYQRTFWNITSSKSDNATFNKDYLQRIQITVPDIEEQQESLKRIARLKALKSTIESLNQAADLSYRTVGVAGPIVETLSMDSLFDVFGGNTGLTEEFIYHSLPLSDSDVLEIITGATLSENSMGFVSREAALQWKPDLTIFDQESILLTRKGYYAGTLIYLSPRYFITNDDVYVVQPKPLWRDKINLKWFIYQYQITIRNTVTSKSDNATFNKSWLGRLSVDLPDRPTQDVLANKITAIHKLSSGLESVDREIYNLTVQPISLT